MVGVAHDDKLIFLNCKGTIYCWNQQSVIVQFINLTAIKQGILFIKKAKTILVLAVRRNLISIFVIQT